MGDLTLTIQQFSKPIDQIAENFGIEFLVYFGSFQTEYYHSESDIDIAFLTTRPLSIDEKTELLEELILYHRKSEIDLVDLRTAEPIFRYEVARSGRVLYERETGLFERYGLFYIKQCYELKAVLEAEMQKIGKFIQEVTDHG